MDKEQPSSLPAPKRPRMRQVAGVMLLLGMGLVILARAVRPLPSDANPYIVLLVGILPNIGASLGMPFLVEAFESILGQKVVWLLQLPFWVLSLCVLGVLIMWEYISWVAWGYEIDPNDLLASGIGIGVAIGVHAIAEHWHA